MKAVIILGALALVLVSGLEQNEEESQLSLSEGTLQREARDAQPGKKRNQKKKAQKKKRKSQKKKKSMKKKKNAAKKNGAKKAGRRNRRKKGSKNKKRPSKNSSKRRGPVARQSTDCLADVVTAIKGYRSAGNQKRMAMRIVAWKKNMGKKKDKAATQFEDAATSLDSATGGGKTCGSGAPDSDTTDALTKLKNCSKSAAALCDDSTVNDTGADGCKTKFEAYITAFDVSIYIHQHLNVVTYS